MNNDKKFHIYRPLVFLCGPNYKENDSNDRRNVLFNYINNKKEAINIDESKPNFALIPVIVDKIFNKNSYEHLELDPKTLEEIVAAISYRTYIFLDSLSTSFEYGLFDNSLHKNRSVIFLEKHFDERKRRAVGQYLIDTIPPEELIIYEHDEATYGEEEFIGFIKDENGKAIIPKAIKDKIDFDFCKVKDAAENGFELSFTKLPKEETQKSGAIYYSITNDFKNIVFKINTRFAFYLSVMALSNPTVKGMMEKQNFEKGYGDYKKYIFDMFIAATINDGTVNTAALITSKPNIIIEIGKYPKSFDIFKHIVFINHSITSLIKKPFNRTVNSLRSNREVKPSFNRITDFNYIDSLFEINDRDKQLINDYCMNSDDYVEDRIIKVSGKNRKIIQYRDTHKGRHLMRLHKRIANVLSSLFPPSKYAYAYKKETCTKMCIEQHIESNHFIKLDVHSFFNSLTTRNVCFSFLKRIMTTLDKRFKPLGPKLKMVNNVLRCCFYKDHLPLGFITSPILSDIYMNWFDNQIGDKYPSIKFTRYADDILISSKRKAKKLKECEQDIIASLSNLKLKTNNKKRLVVSLKNEGDSIRFLGVNIVKRNGYKELTISKSYLLEYARRIYKEKHKKHPDESKIKGILNYVKSISKVSYAHLCKTYLALFKENF